MINVLNKHNTLTNFYHPKKFLIFPKNDYNYISKAKQEYNILINNLQKNLINNNSNNSKNKLIFYSSNRYLNYLNGNSPKITKNIVITATTKNFWKGRNNNNKINYEHFLEKNNNKNIVKRNNYLYNSFNTNLFKSERDTTNDERKFKANSKLFELFINDYEKKIKKTIEEIGNNSIKNKEIILENEKNNNKDFNNKIILNSDLENVNSENDNDKNNSSNDFNNKLFQSKPKTSRVKSTDLRRLFKVNSFQNNQKQEENNTKSKKTRPTTSSPYTIHTTINKNIKTYENKLSHYEIGKIIGKGAYAVVKVCKNKITQEKFAMKIYEKKNLKDHIIKKCITKEIEILKKLNHPNIVKLYDVIYTEKYFLLIQELVNGISLRDYYNTEIRNQKSLSENKYKLLTLFFKQIFSAFAHIHKKNIAHRDIKLENILLTKNNEIKIIDFGFGMYNPRNYSQKFFCGTPNYMAPEIILKKEYNGEKADIWSLGVLVYKLFCADFPFKGKNQKELYKDIIRGKYKIKEYVPECVKKVIEKMIRLKPKERINCEQILQSHWFNN